MLLCWMNIADFCIRLKALTGRCTGTSADIIQESMSEGQGTLLKNPEERKISIAAFLLFITIVVQKDKIQEEIV